MHVTHLGRAPAHGTLALRAPDGWSTGAGQKFTGLAPGRTHIAQFPLYPLTAPQAHSPSRPR